MIAITENDPFLYNYVRTMSEMMQSFRRDVDPNEPPLAYPGGMSQFLVEHGSFYRPAALREDVKRGVIKQCFDNAYKLALRRRWRYVEGYAISSTLPLPIHHAWAIDENDRVVDNTWRDIGSSYFGVEFPVGYMREVRKRTDLWPALDNHKNFDLYRTKYDPSALASVGQ